MGECKGHENYTTWFKVSDLGLGADKWFDRGMKRLRSKILKSNRGFGSGNPDLGRRVNGDTEALKFSKTESGVCSRRHGSSDKPSSATKFKAPGSFFNRDIPMKISTKFQHLNLSIVSRKPTDHIRRVDINAKKSFHSRQFLLKSSNGPGPIFLKGSKVASREHYFMDLVVGQVLTLRVLASSTGVSTMMDPGLESARIFSASSCLKRMKKVKALNLSFHLGDQRSMKSADLSSSSSERTNFTMGL